VSTSELSVPNLEACSIRYLALDPALSCGFSVLQLNSSNEILSIDVGVLLVDKSLCTRGAQCNDLQRLLGPLLSPPPDHVFMESYYVHPFRDLKDGRWKVNQEGIDLNYKLRGAIEMALDMHGIGYTEVCQSTWKKSVAGNGSAEKQEVKDSVERTIGFQFHKELFIRGK
jgi:Holliday junction resolvasome RuvABC endonuclease subunit